jgi:hypothetical protein
MMGPEDVQDIELVFVGGVFTVMIQLLCLSIRDYIRVKRENRAALRERRVGR